MCCHEEIIESARVTKYRNSTVQFVALCCALGSSFCRSHVVNTLLVNYQGSNTLIGWTHDPCYDIQSWPSYFSFHSDKTLVRLFS